MISIKSMVHFHQRTNGLYRTILLSHLILQTKNLKTNNIVPQLNEVVELCFEKGNTTSQSTARHEKEMGDEQVSWLWLTMCL